MDQKEHLTTLCALGTLGAAAAGLVFATDHVDVHVLRPGKRKWPGSSGHTWSTSSIAPTLPRRSVSQPATPLLYTEPAGLAPQTLAARRFPSAPRLFGPSREVILEDEQSSQGSSRSRRSLVRPRTAASRSTLEKRDSGSSSGWMKRLSSFSSHNTSPAPSMLLEDGDGQTTGTLSGSRPSVSVESVPNKLVKRSLSQRALSHHEARGQILRRPATSHQRSQTFRDILARSGTNDGMVAVNGSQPPITSDATSAPRERRVWRPFFESRFPRKRRRSESVTDPGQIRVVSIPTKLEPFILLGSELDCVNSTEDVDEFQRHVTDDEVAATQSNRRSRRSLSSLRKSASRRRNFTDPSVYLTKTAVNGTITGLRSAQGSPPIMQKATFSPSLPSDTPTLTSSPLAEAYAPMPFFQPRSSISASDPPTTSSDADPRVFSDGESMEFKSDTAYDSIATRATAASHNVVDASRLETIFAVRTSDETEERLRSWTEMADDPLMTTSEHDLPYRKDVSNMHGIGITMTQGDHSDHETFVDSMRLDTPPLSTIDRSDEFDATPLPFKPKAFDSSPPLLPSLHDSKEYERVGDMLEDMSLDDEHMEWMSAKNPNFASIQPSMSSPGTTFRSLLTRYQETDMHDHAATSRMAKPSLFDYSEQQQMTNFSRPKTVHGKQGHGNRSRHSGRKGGPQLHFRSQSVPVNREGPIDDIAATTKYQTWRLGTKPVSEEWSDDFDFDDTERLAVESPIVDAHPVNFADSARSVRIPQSIIDRQPSVHLQFGQVQEFMALVEELKRLRLRGAELQLLTGNARTLWEDADSIINLATINDEEESIPMSSPASSDPFAEVTTPPASGINAVQPTRARGLTASSRRSVSAMATPAINGRARGHSLAQARHFLQAMHERRDGFGSSPREIEIHRQKKLPFDTQDLKDLVVKSGVITRALKEEVRKAEGVSVSPQKTPPSRKRDDDDHPLNELFRVPEPHEASSPCPPFRNPGLPKSRSAHGYIEKVGSRQGYEPFSSPITLATVV